MPTSADLAHLVEQLICNHQVAGSSPAIGTKFLVKNPSKHLLLGFLL
jgi:hypothetical protein